MIILLIIVRGSMVDEYYTYQIEFINTVGHYLWLTDLPVQGE